MKIIFEDNHIIVVEKPFNILTQSDNTSDKSLYTIVKEYLKKKYHKPGKVYLGIVHRIDRPVKGIIVFAKTSKAASRLSESIRNKQFIKKYYAIVEGRVKNTNWIEIINYLKRNKDKNITNVKNQYVAGFKKSILKYRTLVNSKSVFSQKDLKLIHQIYQRQNIFYSPIEINLITGRHHQIRSQLAHFDYPIVGDIKYGASFPLPNNNILLCCYYLSFPHPTRKISLSFKI